MGEYEQRKVFRDSSGSPDLSIEVDAINVWAGGTHVASGGVWGVQLIDEALGETPNGLPILVSGGEGSGRTTLAIQLADATLRRGGRVVYVTSHPAELILERVASMGLDWQTELSMDQLMLFGLDTSSRIEAGAYGRLLQNQLQAACERPNLVVFDGLDPLEARADSLELAGCLETVFSYGGPIARRVALIDLESGAPSRFRRTLDRLASASIRLDGGRGARQLVVEYERFKPTRLLPQPYAIGETGLFFHAPVEKTPGTTVQPVDGLATRAEPAISAPPSSVQDDAVNSQALIHPLPARAPTRPAEKPRETPALDEGPSQKAALDEGPPQKAALDEGPPQKAALDEGPSQKAALDEGSPETDAHDEGERLRTVLVITNQAGGWRSLCGSLAPFFEMDFVDASGERDLPTLAADHDAVIVDAASMGTESEDLLAALRDHGVPCPVIAITNRHRRSFDRVVTLLRGADDLLPWPPESGKLRQRLEAAIRLRAQEPRSSSPRIGELLPRTTGWRLLDEGSFLELVQRGNQLSAELNLSSSVLNIIASDLTLVSPLIEVIEEELRDSDVLHLVDGGRVLVYLPLTAPDDLKQVLQRLSDGLRRAGVEPLAFKISAHAGDETSRSKLAHTLGLAVQRSEEDDFPVVASQRDEDADLPSAVGARDSTHDEDST